MSTARPALCTPAESLCGISCRRKATPARSRGPEAVGAFTLLMWEATEHGEAGFSLAPAHCYWSWTETWTRCRQLEDIVCNCAKSDNGGWYRRNDSIVISAHVGLHVSLGRRASRPEQPAPTRCVGRQNVLCVALSIERRKPWPSAVEAVALHRIIQHQRKEICNVLEMSWRDYNETYIFTSPLGRNIDVGGEKESGAERILRPGECFGWCLLAPQGAISIQQLMEVHG